MGRGGESFFFGQKFSVKSLNVFGVAQVTIIHNADLTKFGYQKNMIKNLFIFLATNLKPSFGLSLAFPFCLWRDDSGHRFLLDFSPPT
jgi:hypothetical protein